MGESVTALDGKNVAFFQGMLDTSAAIARKYIAQARQGNLAIEDKGGKPSGNPVTLADQEIQEHIQSAIYGDPQKGISPSRFKNAGFLGEEENEILQPREPVGGYPQFRFVVDPIDGTKPFTMGLDHWVVCNFALQQRNAESDGWKTMISGAYAPDKGIAVLADNQQVMLRSHNLFGDNNYHPLSELRPNPVKLEDTLGGVDIQ